MNVGVGNFRKSLQHCEEVAPVVAGECTGNIFPDNVSGVFAIRFLPHLFYNARHFKEQVAAFAFVQTLLLSSYAQILTGRAAADYIDRFYGGAIYIQNAAEVLHVRESCFRNLDRVRLNFRSPNWFYAAHRCGQRCCSASIE